MTGPNNHKGYPEKMADRLSKEQLAHARHLLSQRHPEGKRAPYTQAIVAKMYGLTVSRLNWELRNEE